MPPLTCFCGRVRLTIARRPDFIHACNCTLCSKFGAHWGYFDPSDVAIIGEPRAFRRHDKKEPGVDIHFCGDCGSTTHFTLTELAIAKFGDTLVGVNMQLLGDEDLAGIERRFPDGRSWPGEGPFDYTRPPEIIAASRKPG